MKLNRKGFAITAVLYGLLILFTMLVGSYLLVLSARKNRLDNIIQDVEDTYFNGYVAGSNVENVGPTTEYTVIVQVTDLDGNKLSDAKIDRESNEKTFYTSNGQVIIEHIDPGGQYEFSKVECGDSRITKTSDLLYEGEALWRDIVTVSLSNITGNVTCKVMFN